MTADDDLSQRMQIAQQRIVETAPSEAPAGERDSVLEPAQKKRSDLRPELKTSTRWALLPPFHRVQAARTAVRAAFPVSVRVRIRPHMPHQCRLMRVIRTVPKDKKLQMELVFMVLALRLFHAYPHRFVGLNNTSIFCLVLSNCTNRFPCADEVEVSKALLLASEFPTFCEHFSLYA